MDTNDVFLLVIVGIILLEVSYLVYRLPRSVLKTKKQWVLIDTSVLMDGRITPVAATGFIGGTLVIPRSVVRELQFLADNADAEKRARARRGLDVVTELQQMPGLSVELLQDNSDVKEGVDERLLALAKRYSAAICTIDYNLNKVAVVEGVRVLNINELAQSLRMAHLPGEQMLLELVQKGQDSHQAVGYLPDGTMVVVEHANNKIGQTVQIEVVRSLQTAAGKMMFARQAGTKAEASAPQKKPVAQIAEKTKSAGRKAPKPTRNTKQAEVQTKPSNSRGGQQRKKRVDHEAALIRLVDDQK